MIYKITISAKGHPEMLGQPLFPVVVWFWTVWAISCKFFLVSMCTAGPQAYC